MEGGFWQASFSGAPKCLTPNEPEPFYFSPFTIYLLYSRHSILRELCLQSFSPPQPRTFPCLFFYIISSPNHHSLSLLPLPSTTPYTRHNYKLLSAKIISDIGDLLRSRIGPHYKRDTFPTRSTSWPQADSVVFPNLHLSFTLNVPLSQM